MTENEKTGKDNAEGYGCTFRPDESVEAVSDKLVDDTDRDNDTVSGNGEKADGETKNSRDISNGNLVKYTEMTPEQRKAFHSAGGKAGSESRRRRRAAKDILATLLTAKMSPKHVEDVLGTAESLLGPENSSYAVMLAKMIQEACSGNVQAAAFVRDTAGDKPTDKQEITAALTAGDIALAHKVAARLGISDDVAASDD